MSKVFIGMPAYNGEKYIEKAVQSFMGQSYADWRLVISDDASTDSTSALCAKLAAADDRVSYVRHEKNLGMNANFAYLVEKADAPYFMWAAQDDMWEPDFLSRCVAALDAHPDIAVAHTGMANIDSLDRVVREYPHYPSFSGPKSLRTVTRHLLSPEIMGRCNLMYGLIRLNIAREVNRLYGNKVAMLADHAYALGLIVRGGVSIDPKVCYRKRQGGYSDPGGTDADSPDQPARRLEIGNPKNRMYPIARLPRILKAYRAVCRGTGYGSVAVALTILRAPRALMIYLGQRNYRRFIRKILS